MENQDCRLLNSLAIHVHNRQRWIALGNEATRCLWRPICGRLDILRHSHPCSGPGLYSWGCGLDRRQLWDGCFQQTWSQVQLSAIPHNSRPVVLSLFPDLETSFFPLGWLWMLGPSSENQCPQKSLALARGIQLFLIEMHNFLCNHPGKLLELLAALHPLTSRQADRRIH